MDSNRGIQASRIQFTRITELALEMIKTTGTQRRTYYLPVELRLKT